MPRRHRAGKEPAGRDSRHAPQMRGLTTRGRCLAAGGIAAIVCAFLLDERDLLRVGVVAAALPVVALIAVFGRPATLIATHRASPSRLHPGSSGTVELRISNVSDRRSRMLLLTDDPVPGLTDGVRCVLPSLRRRATAVVRYGLRAAHRGRFEIGHVTIRSGDPLGLCVHERTLTAGADVLVVPLVAPLSGLPAMSGDRSVAGGSAASGAAGGEPDVRVRPYHPGDDIRTIHWRASARRDDLMVRTRLPIAHGNATVLIDNRAAAHRGQAPDSSLETAISMAASIGLHVLMNDFHLLLTTQSGSVIAKGTDASDDVLVGLADLTPSGATVLETRPIAAAGMLIAVTGALTARDADRLISTYPSGRRCMAFVVDVDDWDATHTSESASSGAPLPAQSAASALRAGGWSASVLRRGDDIAAVWRSSQGSATVGRFVS